MPNESEFYNFTILHFYILQFLFQLIDTLLNTEGAY